MQDFIRKILIPVQLDTASFSIASQVAEFAQLHNADLHLIHIADMRECRNRLLTLFTNTGAKRYHQLTQHKTALLNTWKIRLETDYQIIVKTKIDWGNWKTEVLKYATENKADLLALSDYPPFAKRSFFRKSPIEYMIEKSSCPVITFFPGKHSMHEWKQIVMPITNCIPEMRIRTIVDIARQLKLKIHLITASNTEKNSQTSDVYFLIETLKRLKAAGNIQIECKHLHANGNPIPCFLRYAHTMKADLMITNMRDNTAQNPKPAESFYFMEYA